MMATNSTWDPCTTVDTQLSQAATERILKEIKDIRSKECRLPHIYVYFVEEDISKVHVLLVGELYTPYEGGFFYFLIRFPPNYPKEPPKVKLMNTGGERVRFNPNVYASGKVCHGILGTWGEKAWKPEFKLIDVLDVIQSMLQENPFEKEPDPSQPFSGKPFPEFPGNDMTKYDDVIRHETLRVAVCDMMEGQVDMPEEMRLEIKNQFKKFYKFYKKTCQDNLHLKDIELNKHDPFSNITLNLGPIPLAAWNFNASQAREGKFDYERILERLEEIRNKLEKDEK